MPTRAEGTNQPGRPLDESDLTILLMERADPLSAFVERKMPADVRRVIDPEDILQNVWVAAFRTISNFTPDGPNSFDKWLTKITENRIIDAIREVRRLKRGGGHRIEHEAGRRTASYLDLFGRVTSKQRTPSSEDAANEAVHAVQIALCTLPDDYRCAITMYHIDHQSRAEVAEAMGKTDPAINSLLYRGLQMLRGRLGPSGKFFSGDG